MKSVERTKKISSNLLKREQEQVCHSKAKSCSDPISTLQNEKKMFICECGEVAEIRLLEKATTTATKSATTAAATAAATAKTTTKATALEQ